jgi:hypothetical protein
MKLKIALQVVIILLLISGIAIPVSSDDNDIKAPLISIQWEHGLISETWTTVYWETNEPAIGGVAWGLTPQYGNVIKESGNYTTQHFVNITGLTRDTDYYVLIFSMDPHNNTGYYSFELGTYPKGIDTTPDYYWTMVIIASVILIPIIVGIYIYHARRKR